MNISSELIAFTDSELKEIFSLFCSCSTHERSQIYDPQHYLYFEKVNLLEEYELTEEKSEYAYDAIRATFYFLHRNGFRLEKNGEILSLSGIDGNFLS